MRRKLIRLIFFILPVILTAGVCIAGAQADRAEGVISAASLGTEKDVTYSCNIAQAADPDFVLVAFEGSRMDPRKEGGSVIYTEGLEQFNVIDFSIADELCSWEKKKWESVSSLYAAAILDALSGRFGRVGNVGVYAFSKGASAADCVCRALRDAGITISFIWLNDAFSTHGLPYVTELMENKEILLYNRYSRDDRVNTLSKALHRDFQDLSNVDSRHISTYHGGLVKYDTFAQELVSAITKASFVP